MERSKSKIKELRKIKGWTLEDLRVELSRHDIEISSQYLGQIENYKKKPKLSIIKKMLKALEASQADAQEIMEMFDLSIQDILEKPKLATERIKKNISGYSELWVCSALPIEYLKEDVFEALQDTIRNKVDFRVTYWFPGECVIRFWELLKKLAVGVSEELLKEKVRCIEGPPEIALFSFGISEPFSHNPGGELMYPSDILNQKEVAEEYEYKTHFLDIYSKEDRTLTQSLSKRQLMKILNIFIPIYEIVRRHPGKKHNGYRMIFPDAPDFSV